MRYVDAGLKRLGRWQRAIKPAVSMLLVIMATGCAAPGSDAYPRASTAPGSEYRFSDVVVAQEGSKLDVAVVTWKTQWTGSAFPGVRRCTWSVLDSSGQVIGTYIDVFVGMNPQAPEAAIPVPVTGAASDAAIECSADRLDDGVPYSYRIENVVPESSRPGSWGIRLDLHWLAEGHSGVVSCLAQLVSSSGGTLRETWVTLYAADGTALQATALVADDVEPTVEARIASARITDCRPFTGSSETP
jgi:hypothetical protein